MAPDESSHVSSLQVLHDLAVTGCGQLGRAPLRAERQVGELPVRALNDDTAARVEDLQPVANEEVTRRLSLWPSYMFLTWEGTKIE